MSDAMRAGKKYYGKYRGVVLNNVDSQQIGRVQVSVPDIGPISSSWALPCLPAAGLNSGILAIPQRGASVWVEFEQGDLDHPIWVGGFWNSATEVPESAEALPPDGILLQTSTGAMISLSEAGIVISSGKGASVSLVGPTVDINAGALTVT
jgi:uncharacterized protein involved in type VI secretion and phage assembly